MADGLSNYAGAIAPNSYVSLLQPFEAKSTIQNFDADNGNFGRRKHCDLPLGNFEPTAVFSMQTIEKAAAATVHISGILIFHDVHVPDTFADAHKHYGHTN